MQSENWYSNLKALSMAISNKHLSYGTLHIQVLCSNTYIYTLTALVFPTVLISQSPNFPGTLKPEKACKLLCHMRDTSLFYRLPALKMDKK